MSGISRFNQAKQRMISPVSLGATGSGGKVSRIIDRAGYEDVEILVGYGAVTATGATVVATIKDGDVTGTLANVTGSLILGSLGLGATTLRADNVSKNCDRNATYLGLKRYVQVTLAPTVSGGLLAEATALLGRPRNGAVPAPV